VTACTAPRHGDDAPDAEAHAVLCRPCRTGLSRDLRRLPGAHADLEQLLVTARVPGRGGGDGLPVNEPVSDCRSQIRHDLTYWCREITAGRGLATPPVVEHGDWARNPVAVMCGWLEPQVTWCTFRPWAGDMADAIGSDAGRAAALLSPFVVKRFLLPVAEPCLACGGRLEAVIYATEGDRRWSYFWCPSCGERTELDDWWGYGHRVAARRSAVAG
jgi:hypothetical protein